MKAIAALLFLVLFACSTTREKPLTGDVLREFQGCHSTDECIRVDNGCCNCANGGETIAINRKTEVAFRAHFPCGMVLCSQKAGECMFREPACVKGHCVLIPQKDAAHFPTENTRGL